MTDIFGAPAVAPAPADPMDVPADTPVAPAVSSARIPGHRTSSSGKTITVQKDDTFRAVAERAGVDPFDLFDCNRGVIGSSPSSIVAGMVLAIPD